MQKSISEHITPLSGLATTAEDQYICKNKSNKVLTECMLPLGNIICKHGINFHSYADDTQLYKSAKSDTIVKLSNMNACLKDIKEWMAQRFLLLNSGKTEILVSIRN